MNKRLLGLICLLMLVTTIMTGTFAIKENEIKLNNIEIEQDDILFKFNDVVLREDSVELEILVTNENDSRIEFSELPRIEINGKIEDKIGYLMNDKALRLRVESRELEADKDIKIIVPSLTFEKPINNINLSLPIENKKIEKNSLSNDQQWLNFKEVKLSKNQGGIIFDVIDNNYPGDFQIFIKGEEVSSGIITITNEYGKIDRGTIFFEIPTNIEIENETLEIRISSVMQKTDGNWLVELPVK